MFEPDEDLRATASACPVCRNPARPLFDVDGYTILRCPDCSHQFAAFSAKPDHVASTYGDAYFFGGGAGYPDYLAEARIRRDAGRRYAALLEPYLAPGRVLDVGSAAGFVLAGLIDRGWRGIGIEPNPTMADCGRRELGLDLRATTLEAFSAETASRNPAGGGGRTGGRPTAQATGDDGFDLVTMIQVIAHFHDLRKALAQAAGLTRIGGHWLIETWDNSSRTARLLGRRWHEYSPPSVLHMFSRNSLVRLLAEHGLEPVAFGRPAKRISGAHVKSLLGHKLGHGPVAAPLRWMLRAVPDRAVLPYPSEDLFWALFRRVGRD
ncbi:MAG: methyltransferase domain-containing protein [Limnobacter sp.]|mgnify:CR=1 FL=1|nr:methyltransferase domain-containing protein [Limnobacter sp.]